MTRRRETIEAAIALILFGCIPVVVKGIAANPYTIGIFRLTCATLGLGLLMAVRGQLTRVTGSDLLRLAAIGILFAAHWLTLFLAIKASSASIAAIGQSTYGIHLLILGAIAGTYKLRATDVIAVLVAAAGAIVIVPQFRLANEVALGMLLATISAMFYATLPILHQRWSHMTSATRALGQFSFALLFFLCFVTKTEWSLAPRDWAGLLFLAIGVTMIGHSLWVRVTTRLSPAATSIIYYGNIPIAVLLGVLLLGEPLTARTVLGAALIIGGSLFGLSRRARQQD